MCTRVCGYARVWVRDCALCECVCVCVCVCVCAVVIAHEVMCVRQVVKEASEDSAMLGEATNAEYTVSPAGEVVIDAAMVRALHTHARTHTRTHVHTHTHIRTHTHIYTHTHTHAHAHAHTHIYIHSYTRTRTYAHTRIHAHTNSHIYTHPYTHPYTHTHIPTHTRIHIHIYYVYARTHAHEIVYGCNRGVVVQRPVSTETSVEVSVALAGAGHKRKSVDAVVRFSAGYMLMCAKRANMSTSISRAMLAAHRGGWEYGSCPTARGKEAGMCPPAAPSACSYVRARTR